MPPNPQASTPGDVAKKKTFDSPFEKWATLLFILPIGVMAAIAILLGITTLFIKFVQLCLAWI